MRRLALALAATLGFTAQLSAASGLLPLKGPRSEVAPGRIAVYSIEGSIPPGLILAGFRQEAGFYRLGGRETWVALLAVPLNAPQGRESLQLRWPGSPRGQWTYLLVGTDPYPRQRRLKVAKLRKKLRAAARANEKEILEKAEAKALGGDPLWQGAFRWPLDGEVVITSPFGASRVYNQGEAKWRHRGVDLRAREGTPVLAPNAGQVLLARKRLHATGGTIMLGHGYGLSTRYYHLSKVLVRNGQSVEKGQVLGLSGSTGLANGPHLHWEMDLRGITVQPQQWVPMDEDEE